MYVVQLTTKAERQLRKIDPSNRRRIQAAVELLSTNPRPPNAKQLVGGGGEWRVRTGEYRVIYEIYDKRLLVLVLQIGHRRDVYGQPRPSN